ncbi:MAG: prephenate dehydrogenase/arogenate dehydrogenase family protein, partial [bacterium]
PVADCVTFGQRHAELWRPGAVVTDVGSVKGPLAEGLTSLLAARNVTVVGSHPMAGSEKSGLAAATAGLYAGTTVFVTPLAGQDEAAGRLERFWQALGAHPERLTPGAHDALVARTSHALHVLAAATVEAVLRHPGATLGTAGGFRDFTRIAASSPEMWTQIFATNHSELLAALDDIGAETARFRELIAAGDWAGVQRYFTTARDRREAWDHAWHRRQEERP